MAVLTHVPRTTDVAMKELVQYWPLQLSVVMAKERIGHKTHVSVPHTPSYQTGTPRQAADPPRWLAAPLPTVCASATIERVPDVMDTHKSKKPIPTLSGILTCA